MVILICSRSRWSPSPRCRTSLRKTRSRSATRGSPTGGWWAWTGASAPWTGWARAGRWRTRFRTASRPSTWTARTTWITPDKCRLRPWCRSTSIASAGLRWAPLPTQLQWSRCSGQSLLDSELVRCWCFEFSYFSVHNEIIYRCLINSAYHTCYVWIIRYNSVK